MSKNSDNSLNIGRNSLIMGAGSLVSRITGVGRSIMLVLAIAATGKAADAFDIANNVPTMLFMILSGGVIDAILVPQIIRLLNGPNADRQVSKMLTLAGLMLLAITAILFVATPFFISFLASPVWSSEQYNLAVGFGFICMPQVFFYGIYTIIGQVLIAKERFATYMWAPIANNVIAIISLGVFVLMFGRANTANPWVNHLEQWDNFRIFWLAGFATLGIAAQAALLIIPFKKSGLKYHFSLHFSGIGLKKTGKIAFWSFAYVLLGQLVTVIITRIASAAPLMDNVVSGLPIGGNAAYTQVLAIYIVPHSLITISLATALYSKLAKAAHEDDKIAVKKNLSYGITLIITIMGLFAPFFFVGSTAIVKVLLPSSTANDQEIIALVVSAISYKLIPMGVLILCQRTFFAFEDAKSVFLFSIPDTVCQVVVIIITCLITPPNSWLICIGFAGVISYTLGAIINFLALGKHIGNRDGKNIIRVIIKVGVCQIPLLVIGIMTCNILGIFEPGLSWLKATGGCFILLITLAFAYTIFLAILRTKELGLITTAVFKSAKRIKVILHK